MKKFDCTVCNGCGKCLGQTKQMEILTLGEGICPPLQNAADIQPDTYIAAVDIGTTTIAMVLRRVVDGAVIDSYKSVNPQRAYGLDVMSRILSAQKDGQAQKMKQLVLEVIEAGICQFRTALQKMGQESASMTLAVAANTTMLYLLRGRDVAELGAAPFAASHLAEESCRLFGMQTVILPGISAFIGADIMAGIYALSLNRAEELTLLLDLGTNGELVLGCRDRLLTTATAAGPAFEGSGADGFAADKTAIIADLKKKGIVDESGLLADPYFNEGVTMEGVLITQNDIRQFQMAKGAVCAGIHILLKKYGTDAEQIKRVCLAGGFGCHLSVEAAIEVGLLPDKFNEKTISVGNTALEGAFYFVRDRLFGTEQRPEKPVRVEHLNLAMEEGFDEIFLENINIKRDKI